MTRKIKKLKRKGNIEEINLNKFKHTNEKLWLIVNLI